MLYNVDIKGVYFMGFFLFILFMLLLFLFIILIGSTLQFSTLMCTRQKVEFEQTIFPSFLSFSSFSIIMFITSIILSKFNINILELIYMLILNLDINFDHFIYAMFSYLGSFMFFTLVQAFCIKLIYLDYIKIFNNIENFILKLFGKEKPKVLNATHGANDNLLNENESQNSYQMSNNRTIKSISFLNSYLISLMSSSLLFFVCILFLFLGTIVGSKIL